MHQEFYLTLQIFHKMLIAFRVDTDDGDDDVGNGDGDDNVDNRDRFITTSCHFHGSK